MLNIITKWIQYCSEKKGIFFSLLLVIISALTLHLTFQFKTTSALEKNLPDADLSDGFKILLQVNKPDEQIFFKIKGNKVLEHVDTLQSLLENVEVLDTFYLKVANSDFDPFAYAKNNAPLLLDPKDYESIAQMMNGTTIDSILAQNHKSLYQITSSIGAQNLFDDPFHLLPKVYAKLGDKNNSEWVFNDGLLLYPDSSAIFARGQFNNRIPVENRAKKLDQFLAKNKTFLATLGIEINYFSPAEIHAANAEQISKDTQYTIWIAVGIIVFLLFFFYRSIWTPLFFLLPSVLAGLGGLSLYFIFNEDISLLALGSASVILGIVLDYSFHFFTHFRSSKDVYITVKDITYPMAVGSFTTCIALFGLLFTDAPVLQQFGLLSGCVLICAFLSVIFILPVVLNLSSWFNFHKRKNIEIGNWKTPKWVQWSVGIFIITVTIFAFNNVSKVSFNGDLSALSFHPQKLKEKENTILNKTVQTDQQLFLIHKGQTKNEAIQAAELTSNKLKNSDFNQYIKQSNLVSDYFISQQARDESIQRWRSFWNQNQDTINTHLNKAINHYNYIDQAYDGFIKWQRYDSSLFEIQNLQPQFPYHTQFEGQEIYVSSVIIDKKHASKFNSLNSSNTTIFNRTSVSNELTATINDNFNFIALLTSCIVFFTLLIIYGRIEITLITFLPMALAWIWILGICGYFNIQFNLVNIIIATFIFGLGDDFAVFLTDAAIDRHKSGKDKSSSFKTGILLSGITTIVGTGVLVFAKHPALYSIGIVSIIGMSSILFLSLTIQPILYKKLIFNRKQKGLPPWTMKSFLVSMFSFTYFLVGCLVINTLLLLVKGLFFISLKKRKLFLHKVIQLYTKSLVYIMINNKKTIINKEHLDFSKPSIIIANHQSFIDLLVVIMLHPKVIILTNNWVYNSPFFGIFIRFLDYLPKDIPFEQLTPKLKTLTDDGYSIVIFPEGTRSKTSKIGRFHKGAFYFAQELNLPITPVLMQGLSYAMRKGDFMLKDANISLKVLPRIQPDDQQWGETYQERTKSISKYFKNEYAKLQSEFKLNQRMYVKSVVSNFTYKSSVIEWYVRIKLKLQMNVLQQIDQQITKNQSVLDLGSGLGYSNMLLSLYNRSCSFEGWDYDEEKVEIAQHSFLPLDFKNKSIVAADIPKKDVYIICDVLHYLSEQEQFDVLKKIFDVMPSNGFILLRDGFIDDHNHDKTKKTEWYSTQLFKFNKVTQPLCFLSLKKLSAFIEKQGFTMEQLHQEKSNSNTLLKITAKGDF